MESDDYSSSDDPQFDDGLGEDLVRNEEDREKLDSMTEAEREQEFFKRCIYFLKGDFMNFDIIKPFLPTCAHNDVACNTVAFLHGACTSCI